jgi:hypothetical protein
MGTSQACIPMIKMDTLMLQICALRNPHICSCAATSQTLTTSVTGSSQRHWQGCSHTSTLPQVRQGSCEATFRMLKRYQIQSRADHI